MHHRPTRALKYADAERILQGGLSIGSSVDLEACRGDLAAADGDGDSRLSQDDFVRFVQLSADGLLDANQLPSEFISMYNWFACGDANVVCPSVVGIDITGAREGEVAKAEQEETLFQLCKVVITESPAAGDVSAAPSLGLDDGAGTYAPTSSPSAAGGITESPVAGDVSAAPSLSPTVTAPPSTPGSAPPPTAPPGGAGTAPPSTPGTAPPTAGTAPPSAPATATRPEPTARPSAPSTATRPEPTAEPTDGPLPTYPPTGFGPGTSAPTASPVGTSPEGTSAPAMAPTPEPSPNGTPAPVAAPPATAPNPGPTFGAQSSHPPTIAPGPSAMPVPAATSPPSRPPASATPATVAPGPTIAPQVVDPDDPPYKGPMTSSFEYEVYNSAGADAQSMLADPDYNVTLTFSTQQFVEGVVGETFGTDVDGGSAEQADSSGNLFEGGDEGPGEIDRGEAGRAHVSDGGRRRRRLGLPPHGIAIDRVSGRRRRGLGVSLAPNSVTISDVEDVPCSDSSLAGPCQKVTAETQLNLVDEPQKATELRFQNSISKALVDPGVAFPPSSGISYAGPSGSRGSNVVVSPGTKPDNPPAGAPSGEEEPGTPGWVVPASIGAAAFGAIVLLLLVGSRMQKRKREAIEYQGSPGKPPGDLEGDFMSVPPGMDDHNIRGGANRHGGGAGDLEGGLGSGPTKAPAGRNPFLDDDSDSDSDSVPSGSYSSSASSSGSGSDEDLANQHDPKEHWNRREQEAFEQQRAQARDQAHAQGTAGHPAQAPGRSHSPQSQSQPPRIGPGALEYARLHTLEEVSEENLGASEYSMRSGKPDRSDKSVYRAGVEALVKEACPEKYDMIDDMMAEYEGREEVLIGHLSTMLAHKNRELRGSASSTDVDNDDDDGDDTRYSGSQYTAWTCDYSTIIDTNLSTYRDTLGTMDTAGISAAA